MYFLFMPDIWTSNMHLNSRILKEGLIQDVRMLSQNHAPSRTGMCHYTSIMGPIDDLKILYSAC